MKLLKKYIHLVLLVCILIFSFKARYINPISLADLRPIDAFEYSLSAYNLYQHHIYGIKYLGQYYPPQYPYGYPLLIIPFYVIFGSQPYNAVYCSLFFSLLSIVFAYLIGKELGNRFTGLIAALLVAVLPGNIYYSRYILSETSSAFLFLFVCWLLLKVIHLDSGKQWLLLLFLGLATGFSVSVHINNCLLIPPVLIALLPGRKFNLSSFFKKESIVLFGIILALIPLFLYQFHTFGSPLSTGYQVWYPKIFGNYESFSLKFFAQPHHNLNRGNFIAYLLAFTGLEQRLYPATMVPFLLGGFLFLLSKRRESNEKRIFLIFSFTSIFLLIVFFSFYMRQGAIYLRHLFRGVPLLMILAACGVTFLVDKVIFKSLTKESIFSIIILSLLLMTIIQMSIWSYSQPEFPRWIDNRQYKLIQDISRHIQNNAVIISQLYPIVAEHYLTEYTEDKRIYISLLPNPFWAILEKGKIKPIRYDRSKKYVSLFRAGGALNPRTYNFIRQSLKEGMPVYLIHLPDDPLSKNLFPFIQRYFSLIEQKGDSRLFRLYPKDW